MKQQRVVRRDDPRRCLDVRPHKAWIAFLVEVEGVVGWGERHPEGARQDLDILHVWPQRPDPFALAGVPVLGVLTSAAAPDPVLFAETDDDGLPLRQGCHGGREQGDNRRPNKQSPQFSMLSPCQCPWRA